MRSQKITVINRIWPVLTLYALLLALGFTVAVDPRCKVWKELVQITRRSLALQKMNHPEEKK